MTEAAAATVSAAFERLDLDVIEACAQPENAASFAIMRRLGMVRAGERAVFAPARDCEELCVFYELRRPVQARQGAAYVPGGDGDGRA